MKGTAARSDGMRRKHRNGDRYVYRTGVVTVGNTTVVVRDRRRPGGTASRGTDDAGDDVATKAHEFITDRGRQSRHNDDDATPPDHRDERPGFETK